MEVTGETTFVDLMQARAVDTYASFALTGCPDDAAVLDCGSGNGALAVGIAQARPSARVTAVDIDSSEMSRAIDFCVESDLGNLAFTVGDAQSLPFPDATFDLVFCHSVLEVIADPVLALTEMTRVLRPKGRIAVAAVEYSGMIRSGPSLELLDRFFETREQVWSRLEPPAAPRIGRRLREYLEAAGLTDVDVRASFVSHGTRDAVQAFGNERAADCVDPGFRSAVLGHGLLTEAELTLMQSAWLEWAEDESSFLAFAWCRGIGAKGTTPSSER